MDKPFWKGKKFVYAVSMLAAVILLTLLPSIAAEVGLPLEPESQEALTEIIPGIVVVFAMVIAGHSLQDALSTAKGAQIIGLTLKQAILNILNEIPLESLLREVNIGVSDSDLVPKP